MNKQATEIYSKDKLLNLKTQLYCRYKHMITDLTPEQESALAVTADKWFKIGAATGDCDVLATVEAIKETYKCAKAALPKYFFGPFNNPIECAYGESIGEEIMDAYDNPSEANTEMLRRVEDFFAQENPDIQGLSVKNQIYGSQDASWLSYYDYFDEHFALEGTEELRGLIALAKVCGWWAPYDEAAFFQHRPVSIHFSETAGNAGIRQLSNTEGPAVEFRGYGGANVYAVEGVTVSEKVIRRAYTSSDIDAEKNVEVRRVMIDLYGPDNYMRDSGAELLARDDFGELYNKRVPGDEDILMVKVVNSSPEPDGTYKDYWIRVDPVAYGGVKTPREAIASTWRKTDADGNPGDLRFDDPDDYCEELVAQT